MRKTMMHGKWDIRFEERTEPEVLKPKHAVICLRASSTYGSDLKPLPLISVGY